MDSISKNREKAWSLIEKAFPGSKAAKERMSHISFNSCLKTLVCELFFNDELYKSFSEEEINWLKGYCSYLNKEGFF